MLAKISIQKFTLGFSLLVLFTALFARASAESPAFQTYTQRDGLASDFVTSIAFARDGATWIGTARGATTAQDKYWVTYTAAHGLGNAHITGIAIASDSKIYFATNGGGLSVFDGANRKTYNTGNSAIPSNFLTSVAVDKQNRVWVGTSGAGVAKLEAEQWTKINLPHNYANAFALDANGNPWIATNDGAIFFDGKNLGRLGTQHGFPSNRVNAVAIGADGRVWFGTDNGAVVYDGRALRVYQERDGLANNSVRAIAFDAQRRAWIGTARGISILDGARWIKYTRADGLADDAPTAIAFDARGNAWVGTGHGISAFGDAKLIRPTLAPVVFIHGWHTADSDVLDDTEFRFIRKSLERDGFQVFYAQGISPYRTLFQNAATLRDVIADVKAKTGARQVDLLAFSMGGLNTRAYLESSFYNDDVRRAIILGTPMAGVQLWYPLLTREIEERPTEPSVIELSPEYATLFNRTHTPRATVPYDLVAGDARNQPGLDLLKIFPASDGLIEQWSAHALQGPLVRHVANADAHDWNPSPLPFNITAYLYPAQTYERYIRNGLRDPDARPLGFAAAPVEPLPPRNTAPLSVDTLRAGATITRAIVIDANRAARFFARWDRGDVEMKLRAPDGSRYEPNAPRDATYLKADIGSLIAYSIPRAQVGTWLLTATRLDKDSEPMALTLYADFDADLRLNIGADRAWYDLGAPVVITATLSNRASGADVRAQLQWLGDGATPRGAAREIKIAETMPGFYTQTISDTRRGGYYLLRVSARGAGFARERQMLFSVSPKTAIFTGTQRAHKEDDAWIIEADVEIARAGEFALSAILRNSKGEVILALTAPQALKQGAQTATITIPGRDLRGRAGAHSVDLILLDAAWTAVPVDESLNAMMLEVGQ
jgi:hypothetical protein